jgi:class 3 adenylate cyclase/tetratricopeptide (TPR) repeat protein
MRCSRCGSDNREGRKFCTTCGTAFVASCPKCGAPIQLGESFCGECGTALGEAAPAAAADTARVTASAGGERRHLTVLFCDLVGSTEIASRLDPEEWREIVADYHRAAAQATERFGGHVAHYLGDGVMAYFGWPEAHDNDAERAARAGLAILDVISKLNQPFTRPELSARIGIDSGAVVVGASAGKDADVFGDTPNIAARVQAAAEPGTVVITDATHRLVSGLFVVEDRGAQALKGIQRPVQLYRVIQPSGVRGRLEAAAATRGLTPFVGREDELRLLMSRWECALCGEGQVALIIGEAGIGKSRLVQRFHEQIGGTPHTWIEAHAVAFFQNTPFYPVTELLQQFLSGNGGKPAAEQLAQLEPRLELAGLKPAETIPLIAPLLNLPLSDKYPASSLSPEQQRRRLLATLVEWVLGAARVQPMVIATEDLHWADASTLELIQLLLEQGATARLLLLYTARPEFRAQWPPRAHYTQITLSRLSARNVRTMVEEVAARKAMSDETIATVIERTGGVPLFVEELTRAVLESGDAGLTGRKIPVTLHDSLMARLDRLGPAKEILQIGAVIGGEFSYELLYAVHPIAEENLQRALHNLADAELIYVRGIAPDATYQFKHALIRDAAYEALLKSRRKDLHRLVAHTLTEKFAALEETQPEVLARHWTEAGETEAAIAEWSRSGTAAEARYAFSESQASYQQALALVTLFPESPERDLHELELRQSIVAKLQITKGWAAPETVAAAERIASLAERSGNLTQFGNSLAAKGFTAWISGDLASAAALADQALELGLREGNPTILAFRYLLQLMVRYWRGDLAGAEQNFTTGLKFFDDPGFRQSPVGSAIAAFAYGSCNVWMLGQADVARERFSQMMAAANRNNPHDLAFAGHHGATLLVFMRDYEQAEAMAAQALELSEKNQFPNEAAMAQCPLGRARAQLGGTAGGVALIERGIAGMLVSGQRLGLGIQNAWLAEAQEHAGFLTAALETVQHALDFDQPVFQPETLRICGELRLRQEQTELAERNFHESIALARRMGAKAWELRTTISLARLLVSQDRRDEARAMLTDIYNWFTEGFDTADLKDAKALLDQLAT